MPPKRRLDCPNGNNENKRLRNVGQLPLIFFKTPLQTPSSSILDEPVTNITGASEEGSSSTLSQDEMSNDDLSASDKNSEEIHSLDESVFDPSELSPAQVQPSLPCQGMLAKKGFSRSHTFDGVVPENQLSFFSRATTVPTSVKPSSEEVIDAILEDFETTLSF